MLVRFLSVRTVIPAVCLCVAAVLIGNGAALSVPGIILGDSLALYRIRRYGLYLGGLAAEGSSRAKPVLRQLFSQLLPFAALAAAMVTDVWLFAGVAAGILLVPLVICINAVTEKIGLTHNRWGDKSDSAA
ncbi:hypothetical protein FACS1894191_4680 [Clostridia bacterium]|nr:hypothetical protein FACS1894191_4680 [Clostridia bacterium]